MLGKLGLATACAWLALTASALATPTWLAPTDIAGPTTSITFPEIAVNAGGDAVAIWPRNTGSETVVEVIERPAGGEWSGPEVISDPGEEELSSVHIGLDDAGNAVAVWRAYDFAYVIRTAARPAGGEWSAPEDLFAGGGQSPQLAMNGAGDAVVVWILSVAGGDVVAQAAERPAGGDWLAPDDLSVTGEDAGSPSIAIDAAGTATAVWQLSDPGENEIRAAVRTASDNWSAPQPLSTPGENAQASPACDKRGGRRGGRLDSREQCPSGGDTPRRWGLVGAKRDLGDGRRTGACSRFKRELVRALAHWSTQ